MWLRIEISWNYKCCSSTFVSYSDQQTLTLDKQALMKLPRLYEAVIPRYKKLYRAALSCFQSKEKLTKTAANCFGEVSCKAPSINSSQAFSQCSQAQHLHKGAAAGFRLKPLAPSQLCFEHLSEPSHDRLLQVCSTRSVTSKEKLSGLHGKSPFLKS